MSEINAQQHDAQLLRLSDAQKAQRKAQSQLVKKAQKGDEKAFEDLIRQKSKSILYLALRFISNPNDAEECAQEATLKAYQGITKLNNPDSFDMWFYGIMKNTCYQKMKEKGRNIASISTDDNEENILDSFQEERLEFLPAEYAENAESRKQLMTLIGDLPANYQEVLMLFYFEGFSYKEIAESMNVSEKKVTNDLDRARKSLRSKLEKTRSFGMLAMAIPSGSFPVLSQVYLQDCAHSITPGMEGRFEAFVEHLPSFSAATTGGSAALVSTSSKAGMGTGTKVALASLGAALGLGALAAALVLSMPKTPQVNTPATQTQSTQQEDAPPQNKQDSINNVADMIGNDLELQLHTFEQNGTDAASAAAFLAHIAATQQGKAQDQKGFDYALYCLSKQDKQLFVVIKSMPNTDHVEMAHVFQAQGQTPYMLEFMDLFNN